MIRPPGERATPEGDAAALDPAVGSILDRVRPSRILDVGCGCGRRTVALSRRGERVIGVDPLSSLASRWHGSTSTAPVSFACMDGEFLGFRDAAFPMVCERASLHHMDEWERTLAEMVRVSFRYILVEEPVDDLRSPGKQAAWEAQGLFLELQHEVGYRHHRHLDPEDLLAAVRRLAWVVEAAVVRQDDPVEFDAFFEAYGSFAVRSARPSYWRTRLEDLRARLGTTRPVEHDRFLLLAEKRLGREAARA